MHIDSLRFVRLIGRGVGLFAGLLAAALVSTWTIARFGDKPVGLGVTDGKLAPLPNTPNAVASYAAGAYPQMEPLRFDGDAAVARDQLLAILRAMPRVRIETADERYIHATFRSFIFRFVDDAEFLIDESAGVIHFRSAARLGQGDLGVNPKRMQAIQTTWQAR